MKIIEAILSLINSPSIIKTPTVLDETITIGFSNYSPVCRVFEIAGDRYFFERVGRGRYRVYSWHEAVDYVGFVRAASDWEAAERFAEAGALRGV